MAEYISKEMAINFLCRLNEDIRFVNDMPTIDIVHCSECKKWDSALKVCKPYFLEDIVKSTNADWFCADGERKE